MSTGAAELVAKKLVLTPRFLLWGAFLQTVKTTSSGYDMLYIDLGRLFLNFKCVGVFA